ncbi:MAG: 50S ribosomal protein L6 [Bacillota bacterium]|nr:50S ribosomal protein L6 [Bacillota bacterium]
MSRIGLNPITLPAGVEVKVGDGNVVFVKGPKGELQEKISDLLKIEIKDGVLTVARDGDEAVKRSQHGLARTLINNMVVGVTEGYQKKLELIGVGYKAEKKGKKLVLNLGYSHPVELEDPEGIETETPDANTVIVKGIDKAKVGNYAADIRAWRKPEPYKGKGIRYEGEYVRRKEGKTGVAASS